MLRKGKFQGDREQVVGQDRIYLWSDRYIVIRAKIKLLGTVGPQVIVSDCSFLDAGASDQPRYLLKPASPLRKFFFPHSSSTLPLTPLEQIQPHPYPLDTLVDLALLLHRASHLHSPLGSSF